MLEALDHKVLWVSQALVVPLGCLELLDHQASRDPLDNKEARAFKEALVPQGQQVQLVHRGKMDQQGQQEIKVYLDQLEC